ncbi:DUF3794 domain-containing protein [Fuchsiella alkaliacetigena]|uniref:DUF3794 domain-containing protein n=1 Tax=Fuchsiella alkaliacetigena TaxID=957042 RepID=UPI00200A5679|nr:DUF3794 domain-containing protein [Fuchsiella alkaliacetigena]MCK8824983.1 DUF3794 domain-containing protein [Fuchsiella alkaliacetigena]
MDQCTAIELLKLPVLVGEGSTQEMLVNDLDLEFPAQKVRNIDAYITELHHEIIGNKVVVQGVVHKQVFYVTEDNIIQHQSEDIEFSTFIDVPGAAPDMEVDIKTAIESIKAELLPAGTVLHQKVLISIRVFVEEIQQIFVEIGEGPLVLADRVIGENDSQTMLENILELDTPAIKVTDIRARLEDISTEVIEDKVLVQGILHKQIYFVGEDNVEYHQQENIPFSEFVDLPGAKSGMEVQVHPQIEHIKRELDAQGLNLEQKVVINFFVKVTEQAQLKVELDANGKEVRLNPVLGEDTGQILHEDTLSLDVPAIKIKDIEVSLEEIETQLVTDKVVLQGIIHKQIYFVGEDNVEYHQQDETSFSGFIDLPGVSADCTDVVVKARVEYVKPILNEAGTELTQKIVIELFVKAFQEPAVKYQLAMPDVSSSLQLAKPIKQEKIKESCNWEAVETEEDLVESESDE